MYFFPNLEPVHCFMSGSKLRCLEKHQCSETCPRKTEIPMLTIKGNSMEQKGNNKDKSSSRYYESKVREFQKIIYFCFIDYTKAFDCVDHKKLWKILKVMGIPDHLTCLLRNL